MTDSAAMPPVAPSDPSLSPLPPDARPYLVCVLYYGAVDREHDRCVKRLREFPLSVGNVLELTGCPYIDIGRGIASTKVLDSPEYGGLLFIDHDMVFEPEEAVATIESARESQSVVGAAYSMRKPGAIIGAVDGSRLPEGAQVTFFKGGQRLAANYLGMGMTAIPRSVLERLVAASAADLARRMALWNDLCASIRALSMTEDTAAVGDRALDILDEFAELALAEKLPRLRTGISDAPVVPFFSLLIRGGYYYGEDVSFCQRCHDENVPVALDTRIRVYHKGSYCYGLEDVGMEVPYCESLISVDTKDPKPKAAIHSKDESLRELNAGLATTLPAPPVLEPSEFLPSFDPSETAEVTA